MTVLDIDNLTKPDYLQQIPGMTEALAGHFHEACLVCLQHHDHRPGVILQTDGNLAPPTSPTLTWNTSLPSNASQAYADMQNATEDGAIAIATLIITELTDFKIFSQSPKGLGFDYYLCPKGDDCSTRTSETSETNEMNFLAGSYHLEVSGILRETPKNSRRFRLQQKQQRFQHYNTPGPNVIVIVAFDTPATTMEFCDDESSDNSG